MNRNYEFGDGYDENGQDAGRDVAATDAAIYGDLRDRSAPVMVRAIPIGDIWPDVRQPRRAIPPGIRAEWDGDPDAVMDMLASWHAATEQIIGAGINLHEQIMAYDGQEFEIEDPVALEYLELVSLAASILRDGLTNPITVVKVHQGAMDRWVIETGERRWLAHHLLRHFAHQKFERIAAREVQSTNVWKQAAENGARRPLNAIGMARQLALLLMDMHDGAPGVKFDPFEALVFPGECDRKFYAQVRNGQLYQVKRGYMQRVLDVTGLRSRNQVAQYRNLLNLPDADWMQADLENWTEFKCRSVLDAIRDTNQAGLRNASGKATTGQDGQTAGVMSPTGDTSPEKRFESASPGLLPGNGEGEVPDRRYALESSQFEPQGDGEQNVAYGDPQDYLGLDEWDEDELLDESGDDFEVPVLSTDPLVTEYEVIHQMLHTLVLVARKARRREEEEALRKLMLLSEDEIRRMVVNGDEGFLRLMDAYQQRVVNHLDFVHGELMVWIEKLRHTGQSLYQTYGLH